MKFKRLSTARFISSLLMIALLSTGFTLPVWAQRSRPVVITFGQPNIWSLEQAHYLLARMHRQNLDLQTAALGALDPNATNASRIEILKTLLQAGVSFDQAVGLNNELLRRDRVFNSDRRRQLLNNRTTLQTESTQLAREIAALRADKANATTEPERARIQELIDARTQQKAAVDNELTQTNDEAKDLTSASGEFQSATVPEFSTSTITGDLDNLIDQVKLVDPSLAATLRLDNHIQLQYEIISKQLTLLRDEIGPGERLVFLELPQSINATQDRAADKMAQTWWRIAGYTTVNSHQVMVRELTTLFDEINRMESEIRRVETQQNWLRVNAHNKGQLMTQLTELSSRQRDRQTRLQQIKERIKALDEPRRVQTLQDETLRAQLIYDRDELIKEIEAREDSMDKTRQAIQKIDDQEIKLSNERARLVQAFTSLSTKYDKLQVQQVRNEIRRLQNNADRLLQSGGADTTRVIDETLELLKNHDFTKAAYPKTAPNTEECEKTSTCPIRKFVNLEEDIAAAMKAEQEAEKVNQNPELKLRSVRTIDIIPRQNAINVQDTKQTVARTGIFAALSFLFGFAGKFTYERQREQAQQFLNQELFTSGFGKGEKDFGWSFFPFAGTKQLASGVRTTFAVAIIPDNAETIVLKARGCYFPRKHNQPLSYNIAGSEDWIDDDDASRRMCTPREQVFVLPVPGGSGDGADYYVTGIRYSPHQAPGSRMVASIQGQHLPSQLGVFIDGAPLREAVGLGQLNLESILGNDKTKDNCLGPICGRFERINAHEIVISFEAGPDFKGTPRIALIGPGRSIEINRLNLTVNGQEDTQLASADWMFGRPADPPDPTLRQIADFKVAPPQSAGGLMTGVLTGSRFLPNDSIFVNGMRATKTADCRSDMCIVLFDQQETDHLTVTISPNDGSQAAVTKTFLNPKSLSIISASVVNFVPEEGSHPAVLTVKLDGSGFKQTLEVRIIRSEGDPVEPQKIVPSAGQMFLKVVRPEAVVQINVRDPANNRVVSTVVARPERQPKKEEK